MVKKKEKKQPESTEFSLLSGNINSQTVMKDELGRTPFAKGITRLITTSPENECLVVGIEGAWGEGKSYAIELIRREIEENKLKNIDRRVKWMVFNPWHFTDSEHLASLFLKDLAAFIEREAGLEPPKWLIWLKRKMMPVKKICDFLIKNQLARRLTLFGAGAVFYFLATVADSMPQLTEITAGTALLLWAVYDWTRSPQVMEKSKKDLVRISDLLRDYADILEDYEVALSAKTVDQLKNEVMEKLRNSKLPFSHIVVAVEDLDRLNPEEIRAMVQLMRMIADFPKIIYLVGYDRQHVINALGDMAGRYAGTDEVYAYGEGYLQKVVQAAYQLPRPADHAIAYLTMDRFHRIVAGIYGEDFHRSPYWQRMQPVIAELVTSMRVGERIINRSLHMVTMLQNKSDPTDILVASYLMEYQPKLWNWLWGHRNAVLSGGRRLIKNEPERHSLLVQTDRPPNEGYVQDQVRGDKDAKERIADLLKIVFPSLQSDGAYPFSDTERQSFRMGIPEFMEIYFKYEQNPATETPEIVHDLLAAKDDGRRDKVLQKVRAFGDFMLRYVVRDLKDYNEKTPMDWQTQALPLLHSLGTNFDDEENAISILMLAVNFINSQPEKLRVQALNDLLSRWLSDGAKYLPMHLFEKAAMENKFIEYDREMAKSDNPLELHLPESEFNKLKEKLEKQITLWAQNDGSKRWLEHKHAAEMLFMWLRLAPEKARKTLDEWVKNDRNIFELLNGMMQTSYTYGVGEGAVARYGLSKYGLKKLTGMDSADIQARVNEAASNVPYIAKEYPDVIRAARELPERLPE
ncbi:MAG: KAP family P-loop NTPase fold protein [Micavibrio sp.]